MRYGATNKSTTMPELPEVETTRRGIAPHLEGRQITGVIVRQRQLRWPVPPAIRKSLPGQRITSVERRGKYLLLRTAAGTAILHLGMSGALRVVPAATLAEKHDHVDLLLDDERCLRFTDPRRFGSLLWATGDPLQHPLLKALGPEPLDATFSGAHLFARSRGKMIAVKQFIMDSKIVVGVGNIYASEALFRAHIRPGRAAGRVSHAEYLALGRAIKQVLHAAIKKGGTTLRDYTNPDGAPGYFSIHLNVYGRAGEPCRVCGTAIKARVQGQRATYYCANCQK